jgi:hypothetical protein
MYPLILALWVILVGAYLNGPVGDPDLWWHITVGRWIVANQTLPHTDLWNAFSDGTVWRAYSWLHEVLYALIETHFGIQGLWTAQLLLAIVMVGVFIDVFGRLAADRFVGVLLGTAVSVACFQNFSLRPQTVVWLLFALALLLAERISRGQKVSRIVPSMIVVFSLWANSHITFALGLVAMFLWIVQPGRIGVALCVSAVAFLGTLITPYMGGEWLTFFAKSGHPLSLTSIAEFQSATIMRYGAGLIVLMSALLIAGFAKFPRFVPPGRLVLAALFVAGGAAVVKFIPFAAIVLAAVLAVLWRDVKASADPKEPEAGGLLTGVEKLRASLAWLPPVGVAFLLFSVVVVVITRSRQQPLNTALIPVAALDFVKQEKLPPPLLNDFGRGGYVMYRMSDARGELSPEWKVPIDGRTNVNSPKIWSAYRAAVEGRAGWRELLELTRPNTIVWRRESPFIEILKLTGEWREVFSSGSAQRGFVVLIRATGPAIEDRTS